MGILKSAADTVYAFRFIRMLVMKWENWDAYKEGIIDANGKRVKGVTINTLRNSLLGLLSFACALTLKGSYQKHWRGN